MAWVYEASNPIAWANICFSPIVQDITGEYVVYVGGYNIAEFYEYNLRTDVWTRLADPPVAIDYALALSPDGTRLATVGHLGRYLYIYNIATDTWTTSAIAPHIPAGTMLYLHASVWLDNDTIWIDVQGFDGAFWRGKIYRYVVSTDTWTQFPNLITQTYQGGISMSINSAGTRLYISRIGANPWGGLRYTIGTDTYDLFNGGADPGWRWFGSADRNARLWIWRGVLGPGYGHIRYYDCDTEANHPNVIFIPDPYQDDFLDLTCGVFGTEHVIAQHRLLEPRNLAWNTFVVPPYAQTDPATGVT
ncbi:hypothetical protein KKE60_04170 [Patescibacteria group bacterium]|nr:hypothetical protein [Patescibacteria group bacterium]